MAVRAKECCNLVKNTSDLLFPVCLTDEDTTSGKIIGNRPVLLRLLQKQACRNQGNIIQACLADRSRRSANRIGKW